MKLKSVLFGAVALTLGFAGSVPAFAAIDFTGSTVTATLYNPDLSQILGGPTTAVVGAGVEFPSGSINGNTNFSIDITGDQIIYTPLYSGPYGPGTFNGFVFDFSGAPNITGVTLDASSQFIPHQISFTPTSIDLNLSANVVASGQAAILDVTFAPVAVPEPAAWAMFLIGFGGIGWTLRGKRRSQVPTV